MEEENTEEQQHQGGHGTVTDIANGLSEGYDTVVPEYITEGEYTADLLTDVCMNLAKVGTITGGKANVEFLLSVVGSYLLAGKAGTLQEDAVPPGQLFDDSLFPALREMSLQVEEYDPDALEE